MNDRELLELAAQAAGIVIRWKKNSCSGLEDAVIGAGSYTPMYWNPLRDDGDALRLAVAMGMEVYHADDDGIAAYASYPSRRGHSYAIEPHGDDSLAATRRAIVRAAAAIGEAMQ